MRWHAGPLDSVALEVLSDFQWQVQSLTRLLTDYIRAVQWLFRCLDVVGQRLCLIAKSVRIVTFVQKASPYAFVYTRAILPME